MEQDRNIYRENGYQDRSDYLKFLADQYGMSLFEIELISDMLGPEEDFDGLPIALDNEFDRKNYFPIDYNLF